MGTENTGGATPQPEGFLKSVRDLSFVIAVYLYFSGWIYIYSYFDYFGISIRQIDMEFYYFLIYSVDVLLFLKLHWLLTVLAAVAFSLASYGCGKFGLKAYYILCPALFILLYVAAYEAGQDNAFKQRMDGTSSLKPVRFVLKKESEKTASKSKEGAAAAEPDTSEDMREFRQSNARDSLLLLAAGKEEYFLLKIDDNDTTVEATRNEPILVYTLKKEAVTLVKIKK